MTSRLWRAAALLAPAVITMVALATPAAAATALAAASPGWTLTNEYATSPVCYTTSGGSEPLEINLSGTWSTSLTFGASALPAGGSYSDIVYYFASSPYSVLGTGPAPMPAGSSNGTGPFTVTAAPQDFAESYAVTTIPSGLALNSTFTITLWASDGTTTQTEAVPVVIKSSCKRKY
ncbi:MAG TPA: hypothetical protein VN969_27490 [Streptosporangiaceae bacterium]|nr:hypothetical protein [Streptosporangiaceae bacterium]